MVHDSLLSFTAQTGIGNPRGRQVEVRLETAFYEYAATPQPAH
jgi:hypothetical protein